MPRKALRRAFAFVAAAGMVVALSLVPVGTANADELPVGSTTTQCVASGAGGETCTNTYGGDNGWDPTNGVPLGNPPSVTVDQSTNLTYQMVHLSWANFTPSFNLSYLPGYTTNRTENALSIYECRHTAPHLNQDHIDSSAPTGDCYTIGVQKFATAGPVNGLTTFTGADGTGSADFQVETAEQNTFLGCNSANPCSIVVVPNWGGNQLNNTNAPITVANCEDHSQDDPYAGLGYNLDTYVGLPCSWRDRIVLPISFAPTAAQSCPATANQFNAEGGTAIEQAMNQWRPGWCKPAPGQQTVSFGYDSGVDEYHARSDFLSGGQALSSGADVALVNQPASADAQAASSRPFTYAPLAVTGVSIVYYVDDPQTGLPITNLRLNARLMAKLLTQSYALEYGQCTGGDVTDQQQYCDPAVLGNPVDLFDDPEFKALNEGPNTPNQYTAADFPTFNGQNAPATFLPTVLAGNSDLTEELTAWMWSDSSARAFLQGKADPWGMHVNSYYKGIGYPISQFLPQDPGWTGVPAGGSAPNESMQLGWNPVTGLDNVVSTLANNQSSALTNIGVTCSALGWTGGPCNGGNWVYPKATANPEQRGSRSLIAVVDQGDAAAFRFPTAHLLNPAGAAVAPTIESMAAAVGDMQTNPDKITQYPDFTSKDPNAYPLTSVEYAMVPTCHLDSGTAQAIAGFLRDATTGSSQLYGTGLGQLPGFGGYLALNGTQQTQAATAATAVAAQSCASPPPDTTVGGGDQSTVNGSTGIPGGGANANGGASPTSGASPSTSNSPGTHPAASNGSAPIPLGLRSLDINGFGGWALPVALALGGILAIGAGLTYLLTGTAAGRGLLRRIRRKPSVPDAGDVE
ncbi:MAG TPA: hypothetical protein VG247_31955 [Pseudonocardiaceae bacterium]|nr:hypothetical protein [Pseudonocardiaceae bacterium]